MNSKSFVFVRVREGEDVRNKLGLIIFSYIVGEIEVDTLMELREKYENEQ